MGRGRPAVELSGLEHSPSHARTWTVEQTAGRQTMAPAGAMSKRAGPGGVGRDGSTSSPRRTIASRTAVRTGSAEPPVRGAIERGVPTAG
jgi:hypothetical protein